jgi:hypothetical protein
MVTRARVCALCEGVHAAHRARLARTARTMTTNPARVVDDGEQVSLAIRCTSAALLVVSKSRGERRESTLFYSFVSSVAACRRRASREGACVQPGREGLC